MSQGLLTDGRVPNASAAISVSSLDTAGLDPESRVMAICSALLSLLDKRMDEHMKLMEKRGQEAEALRGVLRDLNTALDQFEVGAKADATIPDKSTDPKKVEILAQIKSTLENCGISELANLAPDGVFTKGSVELAISDVTRMLDSKTQIQQKDTFTLQALFGKRNEIYELMSNVFKKCQDSRSVIGRNI